MTGLNQSPGAAEPFDPARDMKCRWTPTADQDQAAEAALREHLDNVKTGRVAPRQGRDRDATYSVQLLTGKEAGWWAEGIEVIGLPGLRWTRNEAIGACEAAVAVHRLLHPDTKVSASWARHRLPQQGEPAPWAGDVTWRTSWSIYEL